MPTPTGFVSTEADAQHTVVVVFLRGGADGLNLVAPVEDDTYYRRRPMIGLGKKAALPLDDMFGLNPALAPLMPIYKNGDMAIVHQAGSEDDTRSHFVAQDFMEHGGMAGGGWLGRYLRQSTGGKTAPLTAVAIGRTQPQVLKGAPSSVVMESFDAFSLGENKDAFLQQLEMLYTNETSELSHAGLDTLSAMKRIRELEQTQYIPASGAVYDNDSFSTGMRQVAQLIKAKVGLRAATLDLNGWDTHFASDTLMNPLMNRLSKGLAAFHKDLGRTMERVSVVVMTEFGRRVYENASFGTDHGRGSVMFLLGGGVRGSQVIHQWAGLGDDVLEGPGDLPVVHDYRDVLSSILTHHDTLADVAGIFPGLPGKTMELYA